MDENTYHIKIKKEYASAIFEDLKQVDAIEIVQEPIPQWQKDESKKRLQELKDEATKEVSEEDAYKTLDEE